MKKGNTGQIVVIIIVVLAVILLLAAILFNLLASFLRFGRISLVREQVLHLAEAGVDKAIWSLNQTAGAYTGETNTTLGPGTFTVLVTTTGPSARTIESIGYVPSSTNPTAKKKIKVKVITSTTNVDFRYGVQVGYGGLEMENNAKVIGNVYSNGSIDGAPGATITGDAWVAGGTSLTADQESTTQTSDFAFADNSTREDAAQSFVPSATNQINKVSLYIKKQGNPSDATVRIVSDDTGKPSKNTLTTGTLESSKVTTNYGWIDVSFDPNPQLQSGTTYWLVIDAPQTSASKYWIWGAQSNSGYTNGQGMYSPDFSAASPSWTAANLDFDFKTFMGGIITEISELNVDGDAHANTIKNSIIGKNAYYQTIIGTSVLGTQYPGSPDPPPEDFPISQSNIDQWKQEAEAGGTQTGDFHPDAGSTVSLGPKKITGNMILDNNQTLTITGTIWVQGYIDISNNAIIKLDPGYGDASGIIVTDSWIHITNNGQFEGSGQAGSYIILLSTVNCMGTEKIGCTDYYAAIDLHNNVTSTIIYASDGLLYLHNNVGVKEAIAQRLHLENNATVTYESGLANTNFSSGPGASWQLKKQTYQFLPF